MFTRSYKLNEIVTYRPIQLLLALFGRWDSLGRVFMEQDVVHLNGHWTWDNFVMAIICKRHSIPYLLQPRGMLWMGHRSLWKKRIFNRLIGRSIVNHASRVLALSRFELEQFRPYQIPEGKVQVVPNPIEKCGAKKSENRTTNPPYFLYLGRIEQRKNLIFLVEAFHAYSKQGGKAHLYLAGPVEYGYDISLKKQITALGLNDRVKLMGPAYSDEKQNLICGSLGLIYPAIGESFGRVPFEAVSFGTYPVIPDRSGSAEYLSPFLPDCIYKEGDVSSLAAALTRLDKGNLKGNSLIKAHEWISSELEPSRVARHVFNIYMQVTKVVHTESPLLDEIASLRSQ
jgi:glycosyltransferase involved in cell wall biosynthesis